MMSRLTFGSLVLGVAFLAGCSAETAEQDLAKLGCNCPTAVEGVACAFSQEDWGTSGQVNPVGHLRDVWFDTLYPEGLTVGTCSPYLLPTSQSVECYLPQAGAAIRGVESNFYGQLTALKLNLTFSNAGVFGAQSDLANARIIGGAFNGWTATQLLTYGEAISPRTANPALVEALTMFNTGFPGCDPASFPPPGPVDEDQDGVPVDEDCDDTNPRVGALLYQSGFDADTGYFSLGDKLTDPWYYHDGLVSPSEGGQQAYLGAEETWPDTVTYLTLSAHGNEDTCDTCGTTDRFRAGVLVRSSRDGDQDEGFHGYRCAVARNAQTDCYKPGNFVQLAAFLDAPEDDISSECATGCPPNTTFDELARADRSEATDVLAGEQARLTMWAVGPQLTCEFEGSDGEKVTASASDYRFQTGGIGLSTLNALGDFDAIKVCVALPGNP